ncbi:MAG: FTR1 family iron permease [Candidatus Schekmanbacteria bacterium]|nr:FTR1 family iron permease [Candidatus Schekmanbacteria bacterium]
MKVRLRIGVLVCLAVLAVPPLEAGTQWERGLEQIETYVAAGLGAYRGGDFARADQSFSDAYFVAYESSGLEIAVRQFISAKRNYRIEKLFRSLRYLVRDQAPPAEIERVAAELRAMLVEDVAALSGLRNDPSFAESAADPGVEPSRSSGARGIFVQSLLIILREGFEAILLLGALVAYLQRTGRRRELRVVYGAGAAAVAASFLTAFLFASVLSVSPAGQEVVEGLTMLLASLVLFYVSYWLVGKAQSRRWQRFIQGTVEDAVSRGSAVALATAAFLAVYREGAETVLFYQALLAGTEGARNAIWSGFGAGCLLLGGLFVIFRKVVATIPLGPFFAVTGGFLYYLAFVFAGKGVHELQEGGLVGDTPLSLLPHVELLGLYPSVQTTVIQGLFVCAAAVVLVGWRRRRDWPHPIASVETPRPVGAGS